MLNRRKFLGGLLAGPAAALSGQTPPLPDKDRKVWVVVGVNWVYNDEFNYQEGDFLTEHLFPDKELADRKCAELIRKFCDEEDPEEFLTPDVTPPNEWYDWPQQQKWDWLLGRTPGPQQLSGGELDGYGWVPEPFSVHEMILPASAAPASWKVREQLMSNAYIHAERSAKKWGGQPDDYLRIHKWFDQVKSQIGDNRHRAVLHNAWGIHLAVEVFGDFLTNSAGRRVFVKEIGEQHVFEDLGFIPSLSECLAGLTLVPWMGGALSACQRRPALVANNSSAPSDRSSVEQ